MRFDGPGQDLPGLAGRQEAAEGKPAVLGDHAAVVKADFVVLAGHLYRPLRIVRGEQEGMADGERERIHELVRAAVVVGLVPLELLDFLAVGARDRVADRIPRETLRHAVHEISLVPVLGGEEFQVESGVSLEFRRHRLVQVHVDPDGGAFAGHDQAGIEIIILETEFHLNRIVLRAHGALRRRRHEVPLLRGVVEPDGAALDGADAVVDDLQAGVFLVIESACK